MTALSWIGYFVALRYIEPAIVTAIVCGFGPPSIIVLERMVRQQKLPSYAYVAAAGTLLGTTVLVWASMAGLSGIKTANPYESLVGLVSAIVSGISQAMTVIATKQLGDKGWNATRIMSHRFHLLIPIAAILAISGPGLSVASFDQMSHMAIAMIFGVALPLWLLQRGILLSTPFTVSVLLSLGPVLTYIVQGFDDRITWSMPSALGCLVVVLFTIYGTVAKSVRVRGRP
jgi:drug/metabolite transporter (DMT)-like permease